ncbi:MAG: hydroxymethylpyrimidine/phosphomethylpyrimidine kinase [Herminiimonas sp.]|nr:hydroxymethylpyrimidine/phosphomethylpyrimidine kinase [Herminiimonas sp.]
MMRPSVLVFAGSDPSGGAGIQADIGAIAAMDAHALPVITALTVQDNDRVFAVHPVPPALIRQQAKALSDKITIGAVKIGVVGNQANAEAIAIAIAVLRLRYPGLPVVLDPVLASGNGDALSAEDAVLAMAPLMAIATLITPNLVEAATLCHGNRRSDSQAEEFFKAGCQNVLVKGGHGTGDTIINRWFARDSSRSWTWPRLPGTFHGSGCTLASAIAAQLALGKPMADALDLAQDYCQKALASSYAIADGQRIPDRSVPISRSPA